MTDYTFILNQTVPFGASASTSSPGSFIGLDGAEVSYDHTGGPLQVEFFGFNFTYPSGPSWMGMDLLLQIDGVDQEPFQRFIPETRFDANLRRFAYVLPSLPAGSHVIRLSARGVLFSGPPIAVRIIGDSTLRLTAQSRILGFSPAGPQRVDAGSSFTATVAIASPEPSDISVDLASRNGFVSLEPPSVIIPAGATTSELLTISGTTGGSDFVTATASGFETVPLTVEVHPVLSSLSPSSGPPGATVTLVGNGFAPGAGVSWANSGERAAHFDSPTSLSARVPDSDPGPVSVQLYVNLQGSEHLTFQVLDYEYVVQNDIRNKWLLRLGGHTGFLGRPLTDELATPDGRGRYNHFEGGSIYWTPEWGAYEVHGLIRQKWSELGWEQGFLGFPVSDESELPGSDGRYSLFEHGIVTWLPGQSDAVAGPHHYERIYSQVRAHILSRFFAIGSKGRRNHPSLQNRLQGPVQANPYTDDQRWRIAESRGENPWLYGSLIHLALAIEHNAGHAESGRVLESALSTLDSLFTWAEPGSETTSRLPQRWDAGMPTDRASETEQFLDGGNGAYAGALPARDMHHYRRRPQDILNKLMGAAEAARYTNDHAAYRDRYRVWELSTDELTGLITLCWAVGKLSKSASLTSTVSRQASFLGNYLANNGYILVRPMGGVSWRGGTGVLPALEHPFSRALSAVTGADFRARTDFDSAMQRAGYWPVLERHIIGGHAAGWTVALLMSTLSPVGSALGLDAAGLEALLAGQVILPGTLGAAAVLSQQPDCFDINEEPGEAALALIFRDAPVKAGLYKALAIGQGDFGHFKSWSVNFHSWIGLTGLDDADATVRDAFTEWFRLRQLHPDKEPKGQGSRTLFAAGVAALVMNDSTSEQRLVARLEQAMVELFRNCYFEPQLPVLDLDGAPHECCFLPHGLYADDSHWLYADDPRTPYGPLDFMAATALAFWHASRRADAGTPVSTARFPQALSPARFDQWPKVAVPTHCLNALQEAGIPIQAIQGNLHPTAGPNGYALFDLPLVPRRSAPPPPAPTSVATDLVCDVTVPVRPIDPSDVATGVTLFPDHEIQIDATGDIRTSNWFFEPRNGPEGRPGPVNEGGWPLHTAIDPAANPFCLLGRLNGYFRIGAGLPRTRWRYPEERPLFLRVNDPGPGDGDGQFDVRIRVWAPAGFDPSQVFSRTSVLHGPSVLETSEPADLIEVTVTPGAVSADTVEFELVTPTNITRRKEIVIRESPATGTGAWTVWTQDGKHRDANGLYLSQLPGATLMFRKMKGGGAVWPMLVLRGLETANPGSRITLTWVQD